MPNFEAIFGNLLGAFADALIVNLGDLGYAVVLWLINLLLLVELPAV
jgi:hypothetical protein